MIIYGHRGAAGEAPENTIAGCRHAIDRGVRHIEIDLQLSSDGQIVIVHDDNLRRTTGVSARIKNCSAAELKALDSRNSGPHWPNKKHTGVPTLAALLKATPELKGIQLEIKAGGKRSNIAILEELATLFPDRRAASGMVITCSNAGVLKDALAVVPWIDRGFVSTVAEPLQTLDNCQCSMLATQWGNCNPRLVRAAHRQNIHVSVWTVNDATLIKNLQRMKVDSVITDYPSMALPLLSALQRS
ncbi:MAG: glycerophosphoryl diester phosphodiesterase [Halieaceae bacterium]|jgi:glycerophosphoryl diester phosphodiesterase